MLRLVSAITLEVRPHGCAVPSRALERASTGVRWATWQMRNPHARGICDQHHCLMRTRELIQENRGPGLILSALLDSTDLMLITI